MHINIGFTVDTFIALANVYIIQDLCGSPNNNVLSQYSESPIHTCFKLSYCYTSYNQSLFNLFYNNMTNYSLLNNLITIVKQMIILPFIFAIIFTTLEQLDMPLSPNIASGSITLIPLASNAFNTHPSSKCHRILPSQTNPKPIAPEKK